MDEYISKSDAVFAACRVLAKFGGCTMGPFCPDYGCKEVREVIDNIPAADVVEVRHGRWVDEVYVWQGLKSAQCNQCKRKTDYYIQPNYCPNCGADMRVKG